MDGITNSTDISLSKLREIVEDGEVWRAIIHGTTESDMTQQLNINNKAETLLPQASGGAKKETSDSLQRT